MNWFKKIFGKKKDQPKSIPSIPSATNTFAPWLDIAKAELGVKEIPGKKHNERILEYHKATSLESTEDEVPWCSSFVSWCLEKAGVPSTRNAWARSYLAWGKRSKLRSWVVSWFSRAVRPRATLLFILGKVIPKLKF